MEPQSKTIRVVIGSASRASGTTDNYVATVSTVLKGVLAVSLVSATVPWPEYLLNPGTYVVVRIDGMEVTTSNDNVLDRSFVALPCLDRIEKILPTTYRPVCPIPKLTQLRVSFVDSAGAPVAFVSDHILQFDVTVTGDLPGNTLPPLEPDDPVPVPSDNRDWSLAEMSTELAELLQGGPAFP